MPVHFKRKSEYDTKFLWNDSYKSQSFEPTFEQAAPLAGCASADLGILREPQFQGKKRVTGPTTSLSTEFNRYPSTPSDDFALLGKNEKFMENVRYKSKTTKSRGASPAKQQKLIKQDKENLRDFAKTAPAPFVDTSKFRAKSTEDPPTPQAPRKEKYAPAGIKKDVKLSKDEKPVRSSKEPRQSIIKHVDANKMESITKEEVKDKLIHNMNEFVQTNMEKGVADSAPEAPADYALRYKAGVSAPRPHRKHSEYSKSFTWKDPVRSSPLLAAEQVVSSTDLKKMNNKVIYNSNPAVAPFRGDFQKASEYAAQFQKYKAVTPPGDREDKAVPTVESQKKRSKVRRSKSMGALRPDKAPPAGSAPLISPDNKRQTVESELQGTALEERVPAATHGKLKRPRSEYSSNFRSPTKYNVERGAWRGADPPQLQPARSGDSDSGKPVLSNWFAEVLELRRKAQEYRRRAQGTHFSREHLVQLMAQQADMWDTISTARSGTSTLSALSLESGMEAQRKKEEDVKSEKEDLKLNDLEGLTKETELCVKGTSHDKTQTKEENVKSEKEDLKLANLEENNHETECTLKQTPLDCKIQTKKENVKSVKEDVKLNKLKETASKTEASIKSTSHDKTQTGSKTEAFVKSTSYNKTQTGSKTEAHVKSTSHDKTQTGSKPEAFVKSTSHNKTQTGSKPEAPVKPSCQGKTQTGSKPEASVKPTSDDKTQTKKKNVKDLKEELKLSNLEENVDQAESPAAKPIQKQTEKAFKKRGQERRATLENRSELDEYEESVKKSSNGDDISLMGHEGSDEEVGKPDMEPIIHDDVTKQRKKRGKQGGQRKTAWEEDQWSELTPVSQENGERNGQGRVPTPKLKKASSSSKRHHFDRTTPIIGGALLTSPPRAEKKTGKRTNISKSWCTPIDFEDESTVVSSESFSKIAGQTKGENYSVQKGPLAAHPTFGSPSKDSHILRDDDLSADVPLVTEFVDSPAKGTKSPAKSTDDEQKTQKPKSSKPRRFDLQPTIKEGYGQTYSKPVAWGIDGGLPVPRIDPDDDVLSVSARSIASSCSLASEVYERAQKRTEEFWGKKGIASR